MNIPSFLVKSYVNRISNSLPLFSWVESNNSRFRCVICGDSKKSQHARRGGIYEYKGEWWYKCLNCGTSIPFVSFLKEHHHSLYIELILDSRKSNLTYNTPTIVEQQKSPTAAKDFNILDYLMPAHASPLCFDYIKSRGIPEKYHQELFFSGNFRQTMKGILPSLGIDKDSADKVKPTPALLIPFIVNTKVIALQSRYFDDSFRYQTLKFADVPKIYGHQHIDTSKDIFVFEGPIKSMFVENSVSTADASLEKATEYFNKDNLILVFDNEPRSAIGVRKIECAIESGFRVVIFPTYIKEKDVDDMVKNGIDVQSNINSWVYQGFKAKIKLNEWKRT